MLQNCQMTDYGEKLDQLEDQLSLELNVIEGKLIFSEEQGGQ